MPEPTDQADKPPYVSLATLLNFLARAGEGALPPRIDKSALENYSGGVQAMMFATLRTIGFIDEQGIVQESMRRAVESEESRKKELRVFAERFYVEQLALARQNATAQMLHESFQRWGFQGSTLRKAVVFYLALTEYLGLETSPHFRAPRQPSPGANSRKVRQRASSRRDDPATDARTAPPLAASGQVATRVVRLGDFGTITLRVEVDWLAMPVDMLTKLRQAIADIEVLARGTVGQEEEER